MNRMVEHTRLRLRIRTRCALALCHLPFAAVAGTGLWDLKQLDAAPKAEWGAWSNGMRSVYYEGEPLSGRTTRVFAWYGVPAETNKPVPALVLVHGGGGKAFPDWVKHWNQRGYAAIAMDTAGCDPKGALADGGPDQKDTTKFRPFADDDAKNMWTYHAVAAVIRAHSLIRSLPEVDAEKTALTGISWGGYLTCITAGLDHRFKAAVPVYGCGFLHENSTWKVSWFDRMEPAQRDRWVRFFDPSSHIGGATCPMLFVNGTCDFAYPMDSHRKTYRLVQTPVTLSFAINRPHGHIWTFREVDAFVDQHLRGAPPLPKLGEAAIDGAIVTASIDRALPVASAFLDYTTDTGTWQKRKWTNVPARVESGHIVADLPTARPLTLYLRAGDATNRFVTTPYLDVP